MSSDNRLKKVNGKKLIHKKEKAYLVDKVLIDELTSGQVNQLLVDRVNKRQSNR